MTEQLMFFESEIDRDPSTRRVLSVQTTVPQVAERVAVHQERKSAYIARDIPDWSWEDLRDYVAAEIEKRFGVFPRDPKKEYGIFKNFVDRWGIASSVAIARYAFETMDGRWKGAPVRFQRFCKNSDPYFAQPIATYLAEHVR